MADLDGILAQPGKLLEMVGGEELVLEAFRDLAKDELKRHIRETLDQNPELKDEVKDAVRRYFEAKVLETMAVLALAKAGAKLSLEALPAELRGKVGRDIAKVIEKDLAAVLEKSL